MEDYIWIIDNLDAYPELKQHMKNDLLDVCTEG